jgi:hypothetical protein
MTLLVTPFTQGQTEGFFFFIMDLNSAKVVGRTQGKMGYKKNQLKEHHWYQADW